LARKIIYVLDNYDYAIKKAKYAKKRIKRFLYEKNSLKYLNYLNKIFHA